MSNVVDLFVIGGGINGCGIARDAAGRGYSVALAEMNDLASGTSSWSTKLVHGGLRYLEHYEFGLVRKALIEREILWAMAPHIIWPLRFVLPHHKGLRPAWLLRLGLFLYDHIGGRKKLPPTKVLDMRTDSAAKPLKPLFTKAFEYSDCWVNDARLVVLSAMDAAERGAEILTRTKVLKAERLTGTNEDKGPWKITVQDGLTEQKQIYHAQYLINAAGPWVDEVISGVVGKNDARNVRLVRGSHIVVNKLFDHERSYMFQNEDDRIIFAIPYEQHYTLIGTTDADHDGSADKVEISKDEIEYLCEAASDYFLEPVTPENIVWTYSGVRPLYDDGASKAQEATRDFVFKQDGSVDNGQMLSIIGGKITTYRKLAESALEYVEDAIGARGPDWTAGSKLPGGEFVETGYEEEVAALKSQYEFLEDNMARRLVRVYGLRAKILLAKARSKADLGKDFGNGLFEAEVKYLMAHEWAIDADDILFRRTKLGIAFTKSQAKVLQDYMKKTCSGKK